MTGTGSVSITRQLLCGEENVTVFLYNCGTLPHGLSSEFCNQDTVYWFRNYGRHIN
jgi:hypothetical protein